PASARSSIGYATDLLCDTWKTSMCHFSKRRGSSAIRRPQHSTTPSNGGPGHRQVGPENLPEPETGREVTRNGKNGGQRTSGANRGGAPRGVCRWICRGDASHPGIHVSPCNGCQTCCSPPAVARPCRTQNGSDADAPAPNRIAASCPKDSQTG